MFAGHDITVSLAKMSFDTDFLNSSYGLMSPEEKKVME